MEAHFARQLQRIERPHAESYVDWEMVGTRPLLNQGSSVTLSLGIVIVSDQERPKRVASWNRRRSQGHFHSLLAKWYHFPRGWGSVGLQGPAAPAALSLYRARYQSSCERWIDMRGRWTPIRDTEVIVDNGIAPGCDILYTVERDKWNVYTWNAIPRPELTTDAVIFFPDSTYWNYGPNDLHGNGMSRFNEHLQRGSLLRGSGERRLWYWQKN